VAGPSFQSFILIIRNSETNVYVQKNQPANFLKDHKNVSLLCCISSLCMQESIESAVRGEKKGRLMSPKFIQGWGVG
jgi:hypothetical protein